MSKSKRIRKSTIRKIEGLLDDWKTDKEIMEELKIAETTYYRYKNQIYEQDKEVLDKIRATELAYSTLQIRKSLEYCIKINRDICETSTDDKARIEASRLIVQARSGLRNLLLEPPYHEQVRLIARDVTEDTKRLSE